VTDAAETASRARANEVLTPYVPRLVVNWLREAPDALDRQVDGSMVFVDISGFTALSERLARRGKIGAELMRDTLNGVFIALLDDAYDYGAGLLKWGGDALLLLFDGPRHEERACRAAWEMQRTLDRVGRLKAGSATVTLQMSVGITTGAFQFFLVGSVHRELLVAGPAATETVAMEAIADAGEIALSPVLAARLDPACVGPAKDISRLLAAPPEVERERSPDVGDISGIDIPACIPVAARAHVLLERSEPEHRTITAAFIDLMDTDELLEHLGSDRLAVALDERFRTIQEAALAYEVPFYESDVGKGSVKALLTAGAPSSTGHDEERMLRALREIVETPGVVPMRVGVNTGKVFTGDFGPAYRRSYRVFGDAINTAARVMSKAEPGQILATDVVLERSRTLFETTPIEPFAAKGKSEPLRASVVGPVRGTKEAERSVTPLVGRDAELEALLAAVDEARRGTGWIIEIAGPAGIGKSRLVAELIARAPDVIVLHARCEEYEASTPYYPMRAPMRSVLGLEADADTPVVEERLREAVGNVDPALLPWLPLLGILLGLDLADTPETHALDDRFLRERLAEVTMKFLYTRLAGTPTMLAVEDVHFMDEATHDLLLRLARAGAELRQIMLVTHKDVGSAWAPQDEEHLQRVSLCLLPLPLQHTAEIVELATEDDPLLPQHVEAIALRSGGNPLFLFELLDAVRRTGASEALPDSVESLIAGDIDRLSPQDRTVLRYAAVLGASFDPALLKTAVRKEVALDDDVWARLADLVDPGPGGTMRFRNTLVRDAAYEGLPYRRRRELHSRVGEAIEATAGVALSEELGALALHFHEAQRWDKAWEYSRMAGDRALAIYANVEAARFYERAVAAAGHLRQVSRAERASAWRRLGTVRERAGAFGPAFAALRQATRLLADDPVARAEVHERRALVRVRVGAYPLALREVALGSRLVQSPDEPGAVRARARLAALRGEIRLLQGHAREALTLAEQALHDAERVDELEAMGRAYSVLDGAHQMLGQPALAVHERKALVIYAELDRLGAVANIEMNLGVQAYSDGRWDEAVDWYTRARADALNAGDRKTAALAAANLGEVLVSRGALDQAEAVLGDARRVLRAMNLAPYVIFADTQLARLALERGLVDEAVDRLVAISGDAERIAHAGISLEVAVYLAHAQVAGGSPAAALDVLGWAEDAAGDEAAFLGVALNRVRGSALLGLGRLADAAARLEEALAGAVKQSLLYEELLILRARADLAEAAGRPRSAEELLRIVEVQKLLGLETRPG
jgi:class 3 adenylate cyclase/tetratricopeptide (TPR) repeat protein